MPHHDLVIIGTGSGNSIPDGYDDLDIAIVEDGKFGGTCLNVGCIPTKMFVHPADLAHGAVDAGRLGVTAHVDAVDWPGMRDRIFGRIDAIEAAGRAYRSGDRTPNITVYAGRGTFSGPKTLAVALHSGESETITADRWILAAGSRAVLPDIEGLDSVTFHTSDTVMRLDALPQRMVIIGGGYIAAEFAHVFASFGTQVTQVVRKSHLLSHHDADISAAFTTAAAAEYDLRTDTTVTKAEQSSAGIRLQITGPDGPDELETDLLLLATGRRPNGDELNVAATGVDLDEHGRVVVDEQQRTTADGIWALGDISTHYPLKHVANHEARVVFHNVLHPESPISSDHRFVPAAVFTEPQIATVGLTEQQAAEQGIEVAIARQEYAGIAAGWAREDTTGFAKLLADPKTGQLLGAHIIGPEAATVIQPLIQAMSFGLPAHRMARGQYWIHPALPELVENALLQLPDPDAATD
ncbi:mycothione reductase [Nakamurella lactea]|uniref:mycothione reductase n=1 Tax=Nakamurella lactea TaxID=459515 RepID=UPI00041D70C0|nr:mycothione reductase [Nakamurella lactea]